MVKTMASSERLVAFGIISAPEYIERRVGSRVTWLAWPNVCRSGCPFSAEFVVRARDAPPSIDQQLQAEHNAHGDVLRIDVQWNETRLRGPSMSLAAWLSYATRAYSKVQCIAKLDDDAYLYTPGLQVMLEDALHAASYPGYIYMGPMSWFHWYPTVFERSGFGWTYTMAWEAGRGCRNRTEAEARCKWRGCGSCVGPFPFVSGYLVIIGKLLADELANSALLADDMTALERAGMLTTRTGGHQFKVMEDIWLGSLLYRRPQLHPVNYIALSEGNEYALVSDGWGLKVTQSALIVHVKNHAKGKQLERFIATHAFKRSSFCQRAHRTLCNLGCDAFFSVEEIQRIRRAPKYAAIWNDRMSNSPFCIATQSRAAYCRVALRPAVCPSKPRDLLNSVHMARALPQAREMIAKLYERS